jgi:hypothetical protein
VTDDDRKRLWRVIESISSYEDRAWARDTITRLENKANWLDKVLVKLEYLARLGREAAEPKPVEAEHVG